MKKITLGLAALFAAFTINAQTTNISFESSEGYTLGEISGQNGWGVTQQVSSQFNIGNNMASDGTYALEVTATNQQYTNADGDVVTVGAFSDSNISINSDVFDISVDMYFPSPTTAGNGSDVHFGTQSSGEGFLTTRMVFDFEGNIFLIDNAGGQAAYTNVGTYSYDTWYTVNISYDFINGTIDYSIDGTNIYSGNVWTSATTVDQLFMVFDNYESGFYADNIVITEDSTMSVDNFNNLDLTHFNNSEVLTIDSNYNLETLEIYSILGKKVSTETLNGNNANINIAHLQNGVYLAKVAAEGKAKTFKFIKK